MGARATDCILVQEYEVRLVTTDLEVYAAWPTRNECACCQNRRLSDKNHWEMNFYSCASEIANAHTVNYFKPIS